MYNCQPNGKQPGLEIGLDFPLMDKLWQVFGISDFFANMISMWLLTYTHYYYNLAKVPFHDS